MSKNWFVGIDVGGTAMKGAVVDDDGCAAPTVSAEVEPGLGQEYGLQQMANLVRHAADAAGLALKDISAIGVAVPGLLDIPGGIILDPPNLRPWSNVPVRRYIESEFHLPTVFQNDANAAAYGEYWVGAGQGARSMVLFTLGTGVGGGLIMDDAIIEGRHSHAGEVGHIRIELTHPRACPCGRMGCLEAYASAPAVVKRTQEALSATDAESVLRGRDAISARDVFDAASDHDPLAVKMVEETAYYLAIGAVNLMHTLDPDMIVFGGGMIASGMPFLERIRRHVRELAFPVPAERTKIEFAQLGASAGFIGAAGCSRALFRRCSK